MAAHSNGQTIIFYPCGFCLSSFFFFPRLFSAVRDSMYTVLPHMVWPQCEFRMCCTWFAEITGHKKYAKNCYLHTIAQLCRAISSQLRHVSTVGKKLVKQQYLFHMSSQYGELRRTNGRDRLVSLGHPSKFQWVSCLGFITALTSLNADQPNFA